ncbi:MAG TPA: MBL fold metallo-hydrolase [Burkholderiales bacterium]|nr:MBL fold metallo-hydrolase [Burkholderiales bacterium]
MRFASLASGSSGNCLVAEAAGTVVLVDCGLALTETERRLARLGLEPSRVSAILVTHEHGDHACGAFEFAAAHRASVYLTHGTAAALKAEGKVLDGVPLVQVNGRQSFFVDAIQLLPFTVPHDAREPVQYVLSDGAAKLGVVTDVGISTVHVEQTLSGLDALVLECNYDHDMLWNGAYPRWLKERIAGPFGHLDNRESERLLGAIDRSRLKHVIGAHLSRENNRPALARAALARALGCEESWVGLATQDEGFGWRSI